MDPRRSEREIRGRRVLEHVYVRLTLAPEKRAELLREAEDEPALTGEAKERLAEMLDLIGEDLALRDLTAAMEALAINRPEGQQFDKLARDLDLR